LVLIAILLSSCTGFTRRYDHATLTPGAASTPSAASATLNPVDAPASKLFSYPWEDVTPYLESLQPSQRTVLSELTGAPQYRIQVSIDQDLMDVTGQQEVLLTNNENTALDRIVFRVFPELFGATVKISAVQVNGTPTPMGQSTRPSILTIPLPEPLQPGESCVISLGYQYTMPKDGSSNYNIFASSDGLLTLAHFYPMLAVYDQDGWHEEIPSMQGDVTYSDASFYLVRVIAPANTTIVASGRETSRSKSGNQQTVEFAIAPARDFFLGAGIDLVPKVTWVDDVKITSYAPKSLQTGNITALDSGGKSIQTIASLVYPYPYSDFKVISTHTSAAGVEYPGLTTINEDFYNPEAEFGGLPSEVMLQSVIVHEAALQWFYNLVGHDQVNLPWLDESLAQYITYRVFERWYGNQGAEGYLASFHQRWERADKQPIPVGMPVADYSETEYSAIVYGRGAIFFVELAKQIGLKNMDQFLREYTRDLRWKNATNEDLQGALENSCSCDLDKQFKEWIYP
jgi:hypothetical protein